MKKSLLAVLLLSCIASASTTVVSPNRFQAFDPDTGAVLSGGKLQSFVCGTSTPSPTFADSTGAVANSNPLILDGGGGGSVWLDPSICYKLVLKDSGDAQVWVLDNVQTPAAGVFTTLTVSGAVSFASTLSASSFTSTVATGTQPYAATSTTKNTNLNADLLDGGDWANPGTALGSGTRVPGTSQLTTLNVSGASTVSGNTTMATANMTGAFTTYNNIALAGQGLLSSVSEIAMTAQTAAIATTTLYVVPADGGGQYLLHWSAKVTTAGTTSTLGALTIVYTDPDGVAVTITAPATITAGTIATTSTANTTGTVLIGMPLHINAKASTNITYAFAYASTGTAMNYNLHIKLVKE